MEEDPPPEDGTPEKPDTPTTAQVSSNELQLRTGATRFQRIGFKILMSHTFERVMGAVIAVNFVVVIVETDNNAKDVVSDDWVWYTSWGLLTTFVIELVAKLFVLRSQFWHEKWNVFDFFVIAIDTTFSLLEVMGLSFLNVSMLRILRLSRLARATKVFRMFPELKLMLAGLAGAVNAIIWGTVLLFVALLVWSVLAVQFIHPLNKTVHEESSVYDGCPRCPRAYESTFQACLTFTTQIVAGDSWGRETQPIIEGYPATAVFFMSVYVSVGLAIMNLILGVVVNVATEARDRLLKEEADEKLMMANQSLNALLVMCQEMDDDGNDELTFDEIKEGYDSNEAFRDTLSDMDIARDDLQIVWNILDSDKSGTVTSKEFVNQIYKMKNSDSQFMLAYIKFYITEIKDKLRGDLFKLGVKMDADLTNLEEEISAEAKIVQEEVQKIDVEEERMQRQREEVQAPVVGTPCKKCGNILMDDANFCRKCGAPTRSLPVQAEVVEPPKSEPEPAVITPLQVDPLNNAESIGLLFDAGSLKELLEAVHIKEGGEEAVISMQKGTPTMTPYSSNHAEMLARLEGVWQQCIVSIDDMRNFHMSLANLLESMIRRVSITIHHTVSASVTTSTSKVPGIIRGATKLQQFTESAISGQERRIDPWLDDRSVTYAEMCSNLDRQGLSEGLSEAQLQIHWKKLKVDDTRPVQSREGTATVCGM